MLALSAAGEGTGSLTAWSSHLFTGRSRWDSGPKSVWVQTPALLLVEQDLTFLNHVNPPLLPLLLGQPLTLPLL